MRRRLQRAGLSWYNQSDITKEEIAMQEPTAALPGSDKRVSRIFLGLASPPYTAGEQNKLLDEMFDLGITAFDAARVYKGAEECLGAWVAARGNRDKIFIETKCAHPSVFGRSRVDAKSIRKDAERSLRALRTDYIDLLLLHRDDERLPVSSMVEALGALYKEGKVRAFGASNWRHERIAAANAYAKEQGLPPFAASSVHFGLAEQVENPWPGACVSVTGEGEQAARDWYKETQTPLIAYSSLGRGMLSGRVKTQDPATAASLDGFARRGYFCGRNMERLSRCEQLAAEKGAAVAQIALAWTFQSGLNAFAVLSTASPAHMRANLSALRLELSEAECRWLNLESEERE